MSSLYLLVFYWSFIVIVFMKFVNSVLLICEFGYCIRVS